MKDILLKRIENHDVPEIINELKALGIEYEVLI